MSKLLGKIIIEILANKLIITIGDGHLALAQNTPLTFTCYCNYFGRQLELEVHTRTYLIKLNYWWYSSSGTPVRFCRQQKNCNHLEGLSDTNWSTYAAVHEFYHGVVNPMTTS